MRRKEREMQLLAGELVSDSSSDDESDCKEEDMAPAKRAQIRLYNEDLARATRKPLGVWKDVGASVGVFSLSWS